MNHFVRPCRAAGALLFALAAALPALAATPAKAPLPNPELDKLFARLAQTQSEEQAKPIEQEIEQRFLESDSPTIDVLMTRAAAALQAGDDTTAKQLLDYVTNIAPDYAEGWHQKGRLEAAANDDEHALVSFQKAVTLNPREFVAQVELGEMLMSYNQKAAALKYFRQALALDPHYEGLDKRVDQLAREVEGEKI